ncbi:hypothetical protein ASZ90_010920 [hydrocarbon metagenome]|uniref:DUF1917 domain-containing protein n=1 Tax=hydrocarbon metagenome TaxID=938273 RepID=A0A0W8FEQ1_9ZZZZ|nr:DUF1917 domain-containing protein [Methanomicrobiaceae archaeon]
MDDVDPGALADTAYGVFEILLNRKLSARGPYLYERVEQNIDFRNDFLEVFREFEAEYPLLAHALLERFGSPDAIYDLLLEGEGVTPTKTTLIYWIVQDAPHFRGGETDVELGGKWLIFVNPDEADEAWRRVRDETAAGRLGISARVSTGKPNPDARDDRIVIYVHTQDWRDEAEVMRVRERLRELGFTERIGYKRNIETYQGEYSEKGKRVTFYSA